MPEMITRTKCLLLCLIILLMATSTFAQEREPDHNELRALLRAATEAMNAGNFDALKPLFYSKFSITTVDQKLFTSIDEFKAYYDGLLKGDKAALKSVAFKPEPDALTDFVGDNLGLSHGTSTDTYTFSDGDVRTMTSRWTATVYKDNGKWKILNLHLGVNLLDNPVVTALKGYTYKAGLGAGAGGLIVGFLIAWVLRGRSRNRRA
jgi:hypothetical protein